MLRRYLDNLVQLTHDADIHTDVEDLLNRLHALWTTNKTRDHLRTRSDPHPHPHPHSHPPSPSHPPTHPHPRRTVSTLMLQRVVRALGGVRVHMCASGGGGGGGVGGGGGDEGEARSLCSQGVVSALADQIKGDLNPNIKTILLK